MRGCRLLLHSLHWLNPLIFLSTLLHLPLTSPSIFFLFSLFPTVQILFHLSFIFLTPSALILFSSPSFPPQFCQPQLHHWVYPPSIIHCNLPPIISLLLARYLSLSCPVSAPHPSLSSFSLSQQEAEGCQSVLLLSEHTHAHTWTHKHLPRGCWTSVYPAVVPICSPRWGGICLYFITLPTHPRGWGYGSMATHCGPGLLLRVRSMHFG